MNGPTLHLVPDLAPAWRTCARREGEPPPPGGIYTHGTPPREPAREVPVEQSELQYYTSGRALVDALDGAENRGRGSAGGPRTKGRKAGEHKLPRLLPGAATLSQLDRLRAKAGLTKAQLGKLCGINGNAGIYSRLSGRDGWLPDEWARAKRAVGMK